MASKAKGLSTPILFIVYNRLDTTIRVFENIKKVCPRKLYIASDGHQNNSRDEKKVNDVRNFLISNINWNCEIKTLFRKSNLGCKDGVQNAISWFFENEEKGIILEDDCLPSISFFYYCKELLGQYKDDLRIFSISGTNLQSTSKMAHSYSFCYYPWPWGWATWRNRWLTHLRVLENFEVLIEKPQLSTKLKNRNANKKILSNAKLAYQGSIDTWDFLWAFSVIANNGIITIPAKNLVSNIGFGLEATHTTHSRQYIDENFDLNFPLKHPVICIPNEEFDELHYAKLFGPLSFFTKLYSPKHCYYFIKSRIDIIFKNLKK